MACTCRLYRLQSSGSGTCNHQAVSLGREMASFKPETITIQCKIDYRLADDLIIELVAQFNSATLVELEDGKRTLLSKTDPNQRQAIAKRLLTPSTHLKASVNPCKKVQCMSRF